MLPDSKQHHGMCPDNVAVIGGGRWARVLAEVLCTLAPLSVKLSIHSLHNAKGMETWVSDRGLENRIGVYSFLPSFSSNTSNAIIVVNAASDHEKTVEWALGQDCPVLVEKPLCLNLFASQRLANLALTRNLYLATAHVFLFASYVDAFRGLVADESEIVSIRVFWMDPQSESRYGEVKSYDSALPVYADWLPHTLSILGACVTAPAQLCENLEFSRGGAHLNIHLTYGQIPCAIELVRNGSSRQRIVEVTTRQKKITLDFSCEPGVIYTDDIELCGDLNWSDNPKPVAKMLKSFLIGAAGGVRDARLDISIGLNANQVIDQVATLYHVALVSWLNNELAAHQDGISGDLRYALVEILQAKDPNSVISMEQRIDYVYRHVKEHIMPLNVEIGYCAEEVIVMIINQGKALLYL